MEANTCSGQDEEAKMAIAPIERTAEGEPIRRLRVLDGGRRPGAPARRSAVHARGERAEDLRRSRAAHPAGLVRTGHVTVRIADPIAVLSESLWSAPADPAAPREAVAARRAATVRARTLARRRRTIAVGTALLAVVLLAMPLRALGAVTVSGQATPGGVPAGLAPGSVYIVQPGDTVRTIASRVNPAELGVIAREIASSIGSSTVVPGEHITIP
jgi:hypothetical protein